MKRIKTGDSVIVVAGKSKGHVGKILKVLTLGDSDRVIVEGANLVKKHVKPNPQANQPGGIITKEAPLHCSNVALYNSTTKKADRVGFKFLDEAGTKRKVRYFKSNNEIIDAV